MAKREKKPKKTKSQTKNRTNMFCHSCIYFHKFSYSSISKATSYQLNSGILLRPLKRASMNQCLAVVPLTYSINLRPSLETTGLFFLLIFLHTQDLEIFSCLEIPQFETFTSRRKHFLSLGSMPNSFIFSTHLFSTIGLATKI